MSSILFIAVPGGGMEILMKLKETLLQLMDNFNMDDRYLEKLYRSRAGNSTSDCLSIYINHVTFFKVVNV